MRCTSLRGAATASYIVLIGVVALAFGGFGFLQTAIGKKVGCQGEKLLGREATSCGEAQLALGKPAENTPLKSLTGNGPGATVCTRDGCTGVDNCFATGTLVSVPGGFQPIESIAAGDFVLARDEASGELAPRVVTATKRSDHRRVIAVELVNGEHHDRIRVTPEHPFRSSSGWVTADSLSPGDRVLGADGEVTITSMTALASAESVYDLTVDGFHTFFVGEAGAWVHNDCKPGEPGVKKDDKGRVTDVTYPNGSKATITWHPEKPTADSITVTNPDGQTSRMYLKYGGDGVGINKYRWYFDQGKGAGDPEVFRGTVFVDPDGTIKRNANPRVYTTDPKTGVTTLGFMDPIYKETATKDGIRVYASQANNGVKVSVTHPALGKNSGGIWATLPGGAEIDPKIVPSDDGLIHVSLDGGKTVHALVKIEERPLEQKGTNWSDRLVPYYDEKNLRQIVMPLPSDQKEIVVTIVTAKEQRTMTGLKLPDDPNYIIEPRWKLEAKGNRGGETRWVYVRQKDRTIVGENPSAMNFAKFYEAYMKGATTAARMAPFLGGGIMLGEAATGQTLDGRIMTDRERTWHGALGVLSVGLDFGPALYQSAQFAKQAEGVEKALGITNAEAREVLIRANQLSKEEKALLKEIAAGKPVPMESAMPIIAKLESALPKATQARLAPPPRTWQEVERALAAPVVAKAAPTSTFARKLAELPEMSIRALINKYREIKVLRPLLDKATKTTETIPLSQIDMIHPLTFGAAVEKSASRAKALEAHLAANPALTKGEGAILITQATQEQVLKSAGTMRAVRLSDGRLVCFDGNGRLFSFFNLPPAVRNRVSLEIEVLTLPKAETERITKLIGVIRENNGAAGWNPATRQFAPDSNFARWMKSPGVMDQPLGPMMTKLIPSPETATTTRLVITNLAMQRTFESPPQGDFNDDALHQAFLSQVKELEAVLAPAQKHIVAQGGEEKFAAELVARAKAKGITVDPTEALQQFLASAAQNKGKIDGAFVPAASTGLFPGLDDDD